jgi:hypothetical protein
MRSGLYIRNHEAKGRFGASRKSAAEPNQSQIRDAEQWARLRPDYPTIPPQRLKNMQSKLNAVEGWSSRFVADEIGGVGADAVIGAVILNPTRLPTNSPLWVTLIRQAPVGVEMGLAAF